MIIAAAWPHRQFRRQAQIIALVLLLGILAVRTLRDQLDAVTRESPVDFSSLHERHKRSPRSPEKAVRRLNGSYIDDRYVFKSTLKAGGQGSVYLYEDALSIPPKLVIVKTISAVARNELPLRLLPAFQNTTTKWPSEVDASLSVAASTVDGDSPFVPVHDYFILEDCNCAVECEWAWALVTPFITGGTLTDLAKDIRGSDSTELVHETYRPTFTRLLDDLHSLHNRGFCHDDVKPQNIFIESPQRWLLGDLGNTREITHPWHGTHLWQRRNQWSDCQLNDIRRALKSYIFFLRQASIDREQFDWDFLNANNDWSKMYWSFMQDPTIHSPSLTYDRSHSNKNSDVGLPIDGSSRRWYTTCLDKSLRAIAVKQELLCTSLWWKLWLTP